MSEWSPAPEAHPAKTMWKVHNDGAVSKVAVDLGYLATLPYNGGVYFPRLGGIYLEDEGEAVRQGLIWTKEMIRQLQSQEEELAGRASELSHGRYDAPVAATW